MPFKIVIHDGFSTLRERLERKREPAHMLVRGLINDCLIGNRLTIWAFDGKGGNDSRRAIFPNYKNRPPHPSHIQLGMSMLRDLIGHTPAWTVSIDGFEADDVIAALVEYFKDDPIEIVTRDGDLHALADDRRVMCSARAKVPNEHVRLYKLCVGDASDTIPGIRGFGQQTWDALTPDGVEMLRASIEHLFTYGRLLADTPLPKRCLSWLEDVQNVAELKAMWTILQPLPIPNDRLLGAIKAGVDNPAARAAMLKEFIL